MLVKGGKHVALCTRVAADHLATLHLDHLQHSGGLKTYISEKIFPLENSY